MNAVTLANANPSWPVYRLGQLFRERREKVSDKDFPPLSVTKTGIVPQLETAAKSDDGDNRKGVRAGDFVINSRSDRKGSSGLSELDGSVSLINIVLEPQGIFPRFAHHLLRSAAFQEEFYRWGHGIVADLWTTRYSDMKGIPLAVPDVETQKVIAHFLDGETARIDQLIKKKQRLISLLNERSGAAIDAAITSDGGATKLGHHVKIVPGYAFSSSEFSANELDIRLLRGVNVAPGRIRWDDVVYWPKSLAEGLDRFRLAEGDIIMGMDRPWISGGIRVAELTSDDIPSLLLQRVCRIEPLATLARDFLKLLLSSQRFRGYFEPELTGVSVPHISAEQIASFRFSYLPLSEQSERSKTCSAILRDNERLISMTLASLDRVAEFRLSLITSAVTGQIDIAEWRERGRAQKHLDEIEAQPAREAGT